MYQQKCDFRASNVFSFFPSLLSARNLVGMLLLSFKCIKFLFYYASLPFTSNHTHFLICVSTFQKRKKKQLFHFVGKNRKSTKRGEIDFIFHFPSFSLEELPDLPMHHNLKMLTQSLKLSLEPTSSALNETEFAAQEVVLLNE